MSKTTEEHKRLKAYKEQGANWKQWGPYLSERAWGTVREDYSATGEAWDYFPHDHARSRVYRWNEDGLAGICDDKQYLCFSLALWNEKDSILKERLFGLTGQQGNHGEDVKESYFYLDSTPTHSYMRMLYKYPQVAFPYDDLVQENSRRGHSDYEYELLDTGAFAEKRYFDVLVEYAKANEDDILIKISVTNNGPEAAPIHVLPQVWFRNTWSWGYEAGPMNDVAQKPRLEKYDADAIGLEHSALGSYFLFANSSEDGQKWLFTENETNQEKLFGAPNASTYVKDAFHRYVIEGDEEAINPANEGTKAAVHYQATLQAGETKVFNLRLSDTFCNAFEDFDELFNQRQNEANTFFSAIQNKALSEEVKSVQRQAFAGMLWSKQLYYFDIKQWLEGDPGQPPPPEQRKSGRNHQWQHLNNFDVISMPDKWEYPWYASWDLAFHCIPLALVDAEFAKEQLQLIAREWYMHSNGQFPAYEWVFGDVNPPVHAWAAMRVYQIDAKETGKADRDFLEGIFHKLLLNFTWWVNRKDSQGHNVFQGGFLGLDNISVFDRSSPLPTGGYLSQSDSTAWMGFFSLSMLKIALELAKDNPVYEDIATKFFEHFLSIASAINDRDGQGNGLWDETDGIFYDELNLPNGQKVPLKVRSLVGLMPLIAVETFEGDIHKRFPNFAQRMEWFLQNRPDIAGHITDIHEHGSEKRILLSFLSRERLEKLLQHLLDEQEFLSPYGIRSVSKFHEAHPYHFYVGESETFTISYQPAESQSGLFGGNSNWRGPIWFPVNYLIIEALQKYHHYYGDICSVECPAHSGKQENLWDVATELSKRLIKIFMPNHEGIRPVYGVQEAFQHDPNWRDYVLFHEYFHGDNGAGLGASHQTGWTGLVAKLIQQSGDKL